MAAPFAASALAVAEGAANAVGIVRLVCAPSALQIEFVRAAGYAPGFAFGAVTEATRIAVPYAAVRGLLRRGPTLELALDPELAIPHCRFALTRFSPDDTFALVSAQRAREAARAASLALPPVLGVLAVVLAPARLAGGPLGAASFGLLVALVAHLAFRKISAWLAWGGPVSDLYRDAFARELGKRLGIAPAIGEGEVPLPSGAPIRARTGRAGPARGTSPEGAAGLFGPVGQVGQTQTGSPGALVGGGPEGDEAPGWRRPLVIVAVCAASGIVAVAFLQRFALSPTPLPERLRAAVGLEGSARRASGQVTPPAHVRPGAPAPGVAAAEIVAGEEPCFCARADSPLWAEGMPSLSVLPFSRENGRHALEAREEEGEGGPRFDFELAVVNNTSEPLEDVRVVLTFARRNARGERVGVTDRGVYWDRPLKPAQAVKWRVRAPGTEVRIDAPDLPVLGATRPGGAEAAPAPLDAIFELTRARYRAVRLHAAVMLAYLRDPRAGAALRDLGGGSPSEPPPASLEGASPEAVEGLLRARIARAAAPLFLCEARPAARARLEACLFNGLTRQAEGVVVRELGGASGGRAWALPAAVPVHEGVRIALPLGEGESPKEWWIEGTEASLNEAGGDEAAGR